MGGCPCQHGPICANLRQGTYSYAILTSLKAGLTLVGLNIVDAVRPPILGAGRELAGAIDLTTGVAVDCFVDAVN